jgi:hypothetical protein
MTVTVAVKNFVLEPPSGMNQDGHGHYHIYLDMSPDYLTTGWTPTQQIMIPMDTQPGDHTLRVNLTSNMHAPLDPPVEDTVPFKVK